MRNILINFAFFLALLFLFLVIFFTSSIPLYAEEVEEVVITTEVVEDGKGFIEINLIKEEDLVLTEFISIVIASEEKFYTLYLLPENNFKLNTKIDTGDYNILDIGVNGDYRAKYVFNFTESFSIKNINLATPINIEIEKNTNSFLQDKEDIKYDNIINDNENNDILNEIIKENEDAIKDLDIIEDNIVLVEGEIYQEEVSFFTFSNFLLLFLAIMLFLSPVIIVVFLVFNKRD